MGLRFIKIAVVYLLVGTSLGVYMGMKEVFTLAPVHAHLNLLGWVSLALIGIVYHLYPAAAETRLARIHFWIHNLVLPVHGRARAVPDRDHRRGTDPRHLLDRDGRRPRVLRGQPVREREAVAVNRRRRR